MQRTAYVGLCGPLAYNWARFKYRDITDEDYDIVENSFPHPILEGALGLITLYDNIVFLSEALCPLNMKWLPYVSYLSWRPDFDEKFARVHQAATRKKQELEACFPFPHLQLPSFDAAVASVLAGVSDEADRTLYDIRPRNRPLRLGNDNHNELQVMGDSTWLPNAIVDVMTVRAFELENCEIVTNSSSRAAFRCLRPSPGTSSDALGIGHHLILPRLPDYLHVEGPYHRCLEELRNHIYISETREFLDDLLRDGTDKEIAEVAKEVTATALRIRERVFLQAMAGRPEYWTVAKVGLKEAAGLVVPGFGFLSDMWGAAASERAAKDIRWSAFVVAASELRSS